MLHKNVADLNTKMQLYTGLSRICQVKPVFDLSRAHQILLEDIG